MSRVSWQQWRVAGSTLETESLSIKDDCPLPTKGYLSEHTVSAWHWLVTSLRWSRKLTEKAFRFQGIW